MSVKTLNREETGLFSKVANDLVYRQDHLSSFIQRPFSEKAFDQQVLDKKASFGENQRLVLQEVLREQYSGLPNSEQSLNQIQRLGDSNVFTVTTGHQLSLFTGPLYFILKIAHVIQLAKKLNESRADLHVIPMFWMASEDHDFEEIKSCHLFNQTVTWESEQEGAVGRMKTNSWQALTDAIRSFFKNHPEAEIQAYIDSFQGETLSEATRNLVHKLFGNQGLIVLDADDARLKKVLRPVFQDEIENHSAEKLVNQTNERLTQAGYSGQAFARPINFFQLSEGKRLRLKTGTGGVYVDGGEAQSSSYWLECFDQDPGQFSPNVILRPLFQEMILPNLCYVGGGGEMAYWLQLKGVFDHHQVPYPLIQVRLSMMVVDGNVHSKMESLGWTLPDLFKPLHEQKKRYAIEHAEEALDFTKMHEALKQLIEAGKEIVDKVNPNMDSFWGAETKRLEKSVDGFEQKMIKSEKGKHEKALKSMDFIHDRIFPNQGLQERYMNFFQMCADGQVDSHLNEVLEAVDPYEKDLVVLIQD